MDAALRRFYQKCLLSSEKALRPRYVKPKPNAFIDVVILATGSPALCHACVESIRTIHANARIVCVGPYAVSGPQIRHVHYAPRGHFSLNDFPFEQWDQQPTALIVLYNSVCGLGYPNVHAVAQKFNAQKYYAFNIKKRFLSLNFKKRDAACEKLQNVIEQHERTFYAQA